MCESCHHFPQPADHIHTTVQIRIPSRSLHHITVLEAAHIRSDLTAFSSVPQVCPTVRSLLEAFAWNAINTYDGEEEDEEEEEEEEEEEDSGGDE